MNKESLTEGQYYLLINSNTKEETIAYFYYNPDTESQGFGFNTADGGGFLSKSDLIDDTLIRKCFIETIQETILITSRQIVASFAYCIIKQSPYTSVENLKGILEDIRKYLIELTFPDENTFPEKYEISLYKKFSYEELYTLLENIRDNVQSFRKLNITKKEIDNGIEDCDDPKRTTKFSITSKYSYTNRDCDFIDLDACIRNVYNLILFNN